MKNRKFKGILLASDMDGTLYGNTGRILQIDRDAISNFIAEGGTFIPATGRTRISMKPLISQFEMNAPALLANGALAYDYSGDKVLFEQSLEGDYLKAADIVAKEFPNVAVEVHYADEIKTFRPNEGSIRHMEYICEHTQEIGRLENAPLPWLKIVFIDNPEIVVEIREFILNRFGVEFAMMTAYPWFLEFLNKNVNKGAALERLSEMLGFKRENVYCIGDADNDLPMITRFKGFAPDNADPEVKAAAMHTVCDCDSGAVAAAIEWIRNNTN
jgi:Cof subfamily protein (haloacid dehalogenase superfamily)